MDNDTGAEAAASADENVCTLPDGEYAIVEVMGHRTLIGRVEEVERFGTKLLSIEPILRGALLAPQMIGGASIYAFTGCDKATAAARAPRHDYQLPPSIRAVMPPAALPAPPREAVRTFAPRFLVDDDGRDLDDDGIAF